MGRWRFGIFIGGSCGGLWSGRAGQSSHKVERVSFKRTLEVGRLSLTEGTQVFGGPWTEQKLAILRKYLSAYTTALSKTKFKRGYIDAFAGTGQRESSADAKFEESERQRRETGIQQPALLDLSEPLEADGEPVRQFLDGSARVALQCNPAFDSYVFIERDPARCRELDRLKSDFPDMARKILIETGDANTRIQAMCGKDWRRHRAVLFLDSLWNPSALENR